MFRSIAHKADWNTNLQLALELFDLMAWFSRDSQLIVISFILAKRFALIAAVFTIRDVIASQLFGNASAVRSAFEEIVALAELQVYKKKIKLVIKRKIMIKLNH